jgi:hypothetical protein
MGMCMKMIKRAYDAAKQMRAAKVCTTYVVDMHATNPYLCHLGDYTITSPVAIYHYEDGVLAYREMTCDCPFNEAQQSDDDVEQVNAQLSMYGCCVFNAEIPLSRVMEEIDLYYKIIGDEKDLPF